MSELRIVANRIRTPDGQLLQSYHVHDYKTYTDANGLEYMVDGGSEYLRRNVHDSAPYEELSVYTTDPHELIRTAFHWGTRGKDGRQPLTWKPLCALDTDHIKAILETQHQIPAHFSKIFKQELKVRNES